MFASFLRITRSMPKVTRHKHTGMIPRNGLWIVAATGYVSVVIYTSVGSFADTGWLIYPLFGALVLFAVYTEGTRVLWSTACGLYGLVFLGNVVVCASESGLADLKLFHPLFWGLVASAIANLVSRRPAVASVASWLVLASQLVLLALTSAGIVQVGIDAATESRGGPRLRGFFSEPAHLAQSIALIWGCLMLCHPVRGTMSLTSLWLGTVLLLASKSLSGIPVILIGLIITVSQQVSALKRVAMTLCVGALLWGGWVIVATDDGVEARLAGLTAAAFDETSGDRSAYARLGSTLECAKSWVRGNPWIPGGVLTVDAIGDANSPSGNMHNGLVVVAVAGGVPGLLVLCYLCVRGLRSDWKIGICLVTAISLSGRVVALEGAVAVGLLQALGGRIHPTRADLRGSKR